MLGNCIAHDDRINLILLNTETKKTEAVLYKEITSDLEENILPFRKKYADAPSCF